MTQAWHKVPDMTPDQWLSWRREGIGGSDAPAIMGVSPWSTPYQKWEEKVLGSTQSDNSSKRFGRDTEEASRREFEDLMGVRMVPVNIQSIDGTFFRASLDGMDLNGDKIVEIKKANKEDHATALQGKVPNKYIPQCQHILKVSGKQGMYYFSSPADGSPGKIVEVARDDKYIDWELVPAEIEFWKLVIANSPPKLTDRDYVSMEKNKKWLEISQRWKETTSSLRLMENQEKQLRDELIALSKKHNAKGNSLSLSKSVVQGRIDYMKAFEDYVENMRFHYPDVEFKPIPLDPYRKESFVKWTLRGID